ncbi:hypothetical protein MASR2M79_11980 [Aminivibrio sp.]
MSASTTSQNRASSFMKLIRVASMALEAYFVNSAEGMDMGNHAIVPEDKGIEEQLKFGRSVVFRTKDNAVRF